MSTHEERFKTAASMLGLGDTLNNRIPLFRNYECPITLSYAKTMAQWEKEKRDGKWSHGHPLTDETLFVPAGVCAGYEAQSRTNALSSLADLERHIMWAGAHEADALDAGLSGVVETVVRCFQSFTKESRAKLISELS